MKKYIFSFILFLLSANVFAFKLLPQADGRVFVMNDAGERVAAFPKTHFSLRLSNWGKTVRVFDKSEKLVKEFHEPESASRLTNDSGVSNVNSNDTSSSSTSSTAKRKFDSEGGSSNEKRANTPRNDNDGTSSALDEATTSTQGILAPESEESSASSEDVSDVKYLEGPEEHHMALLEAINSAQKNLVICSDTITFLNSDIHAALKRASSRGANITVYYRKEITDPRAKTFLNKIGKVQQLKLHAKFLVVDNMLAVVGSHNWLDFDFNDGMNKSFRISRNTKQTHEIVSLITKRINDYLVPQNRADSPSKTRKKYKMSDSSDYIEAGITHFSLLTTTKEHEDFLLEATRKTTKNIVIHSPFVTFYNAKKRIENLAKIANPGVKIKLKAWNGNGFSELIQFIDGNPKYREIFHIFALPENNHSKLIMIDDMNLWSLGSFNWLSSSLSEGAQGHNLDATVVLEKLNP